jgi:hypothetical protein
LFGHGPAEAFAGRPALYTWLLDHPDRVVLAWRRLGAQCTEVTDHGNGLFGWKDGYGGEVRWQTVHDSPRLRVWYAEGRIRPTLLVPLVPVRLVLMLRHGDRTESLGRTLIYHQAEVFLQMEGATAALLTKMLGSAAPRLAEQGLGQMETFFSGIVWYLDQHPERAETLLAEKPTSRATQQVGPRRAPIVPSERMP